MPELIPADDIEGYNVFRFNRSQAVLDAYNYYKCSKSLEQSLPIKNLFYYNYAIKKCKQLLREYKEVKLYGK